MSTDTTRPETKERGGLIELLVAIAVTAVVVVVGLVAAQRQLDASIEGSRRQLAARQQAESAELGLLFIARTTESLAELDPLSAVWDDTPAAELKLQKQTIAMPMLEQTTVDNVRVQALTDGRLIAWRLEWKDPTHDANVDSGRFSDAVALQFPLEPLAPHTMGDHRHPVSILHWKALWQKDVDEHFQDVQDLHPNYWADLYWFAGGTAPQRVPDDFGDPRSHTWFVAYQAGNPMADFERKLPVEELAAIGFGTLTPQAESLTTGRGVWSDGSWHVVFVRPAQTSDAMDYQFWAGDRGSIGVAVWDGAGGNVGGRKHWTNWTDFTVSH